MKEKAIKSLNILLSFILLISVISFPSIKVNASDGVDAFVDRCYQVALGRAPDKKGKEYWRDQLNNFKSCGTKVVYGFIFSDEYKRKNKSNDEFIEDLYQMFLGRKSDPSGKKNWSKKLSKGTSREQVFAGFANSTEFYGLCEQYGIVAGYFTADYDFNQVNNVNMFVARLYLHTLNRFGEYEGQKDWVEKLLKRKITGADCAHGFFFSNEYMKKNSDSSFINDLYNVLLGRKPDDRGLNDWTNRLQFGATRDEVFAGFVNSKEFEDICKEYGIEKGQYNPTNIGTYDPQKRVIINNDGVCVFSPFLTISNFGVHLLVTVENETNKDIVFYTYNETVNGKRCPGKLAEQVNARQKKDVVVFFRWEDLNRAGISFGTKINTISFNLKGTDRNAQTIWLSRNNPTLYLR